MRVETLPGLANVVRFPVERRVRPTMELLRELAPDVREVLLAVETFGLDVPPHDLRARVDAEAARYIVDQFGGSGGMPLGMLDEMLRPVLARAVAACHAADDLLADAHRARQKLLLAETAGGHWLDPLRERAEALTFRAAKLMLDAHVAVEEAEGVARAVDMARRGQPWAPRNIHDGTEELVMMEECHRARRTASP
ncbi:MAG: hypothetical protein J2P50_19695 [Hyphomicrobiaceae bacterium]|nr:hypothetical protein [Hyphomicrobiaceae bacterium]